MKHQITKKEISGEALAKTLSLYEENKLALDLFIDKLIWWNNKVNLVSRNVSRETLFNHVIHSLLPVAVGLIKNEGTIVDAGSGGGLPAIPLAIVCNSADVISNDIVEKKIMTVRQIGRDVGLSNLKAMPGSIEKLESEEPFLLVSKHAFKIDELYEMTADKNWKSALFYKGYDEGFDELERIQIQLKAEVYRFNFDTPDKFYDGKGLWYIEKINQ